MKKTQKIHTNPLADAWANVQSKLAHAAAEQTHADLDLVVATRELIAAQSRHGAAVARKTTAENRLAKLRSDLGGEVSS